MMIPIGLNCFSTLTVQELAEENDEGCGGDIDGFVCGGGTDLL